VSDDEIEVARGEADQADATIDTDTDTLTAAPGVTEGQMFESSRARVVLAAPATQWDGLLVALLWSKSCGVLKPVESSLLRKGLASSRS
jgi:hypothetical protein